MLDMPKVLRIGFSEEVASETKFEEVYLLNTLGKNFRQNKYKCESLGNKKAYLVQKNAITIQVYRIIEQWR